MEYQTRNVGGDLRIFESFRDAMSHAEIDESVWKVSWSAGEERIRLVRVGYPDLTWKYEPLEIQDIQDLINKEESK